MRGSISDWGRGRQARWAALGLFSVVLPFLIGGGALTAAVFVVIAAIGAMGLNILTGYTGQISLGHAFFLAVGAYTGGVLGADHHLTTAVWLPAAGVAAGLCGLLIGPIALRLRGLYLAVVTLGLVYIGLWAFPNLTAITGGPGGRAFPAVAFGSSLQFGPDLNPPTGFHLFGHAFGEDGAYYFFALLILWLAVGFTYNIQRSRVGRAFQAVRERELAASVMGVDLARTKVAAFVVSSFLAGISGALFASRESFVDPTSWTLPLSVDYVAAIIIGGMGTVLGPVLGSGVVFGLPYVIQHLSFVTSTGSGLSAGDLTTMIYGVLIIVFVVVEPAGLVGLGGRVGSLVARVRRHRDHQDLSRPPPGGRPQDGARSRSHRA